ncbi:MAG TPA: hypothetical protein PLD51_07185 [Pontiellaceae bacterium]|nr:hypothetical protein [Pontiellaceae bacterium]HPR83625.1 hypothetical protein [Pontiellaceae bacterium]
MKKILAARGYHHCKTDDEFTRHGNHARNIQYAFSKEFHRNHETIVDIVFLGADMAGEKLVIGFFRENVSIKNGIMESSDVSIPLSKFSLAEFEKQLDKLIRKGNPFRTGVDGGESF